MDTGSTPVCSIAKQRGIKPLCFAMEQTEIEFFEENARVLHGAAVRWTALSADRVEDETAAVRWTALSTDRVEDETDSRLL